MHENENHQMSDRDRKEIEDAVKEDAEKNQYPGMFKKLFNELVERLRLKFLNKNDIVEENEELIEERDEAFGDNLTTIQEKKEKRNQAIMKRVILFLFIIPIILFVIKILISAWTLYHNDVAQEKKQALLNEQKWKKEVSFNGHLEDAWRTTQAAQVNNLNEQVKQINYDLNYSVSQGFKNIEDKINILSKNTKESIDKVSQNLNTFKRKTSADIQSLQNHNQQVIQKLKNEINHSIAGVENKIHKQSEIVKLPPINSQGSFVSPGSNKNTATAQIQNIKPTFDTKKQEYEQREVSYAVDLQDQNISTLSSFEEPEEENKVEDLVFTVQTGFAQGTIINGVSAPTFQYGKNEPEPIFISLDSLSQIANTFSENMENCIILGTAIGDFGTGRAKIRMSKISCSLQNEDDKMFYIDNPIDGWVFSEDGKTGLKGRLITQEGKIISKALPLGLLQGLISTLAATPTLLNGSISTTSTQQNQNPSNVLGAAALSGINDGSTKIISKIADYYIKLLDALNPIVEIRNGRKVTLAFKGGEKLKLTPYKPVDVSYFDEEE